MSAAQGADPPPKQHDDQQHAAGEQQQEVLDGQGTSAQPAALEEAGGSSRQHQELLAEIKAHPDGADLLITAFYTSAHHYRKSTICTPFPSELFTRASDKEKDFAALQSALAALPPVHTLLGDDGLAALPPASRSLLLWLLLHPARRRRFSLVHLTDVIRQLRQRSGGAWALPAFSATNTPTFLLRAHEGHAQAPFANSTIAYHGTHLENLHSIVHTGLQNLSGTKLQRNGAIFGTGIYLSTNYDTAFSFCEPCPSWPRSRFGTKLRVLLVCEVDLDRATADRDEKSGKTAGSSATGSGALPDTYLLVQRADAVRLLFVAVFCDQRGAARAQRVNWCTVLVVLYAAFLLGRALLSAFKHHPY